MKMKHKMSKENEQDDSKNNYKIIVSEVEKKGYKTKEIDTVLTHLWKNGLSLENIDIAVENVLNALQNKTKLHSVDTNESITNTIPEKKEVKPISTVERKTDLLNRLRKTASIPSVTDVLNGFRQWYSLASNDDKQLFFDISILLPLFSNLIKSELTPSLSYSLTQFFTEIFGFDIINANTLVQYISELTLVTFPSTFPLSTILTNFCQCLIESRHTEEEQYHQHQLHQMQANLTKSYTKHSVLSITDQIQQEYNHIVSKYASLSTVETMKDISKQPKSIQFPSISSIVMPTIITADEMELTVDDMTKQYDLESIHLLEMKKKFTDLKQRREALLQELNEVNKACNETELMITQYEEKQAEVLNTLQLKKSELKELKRKQLEQHELSTITSHIDSIFTSIIAVLNKEVIIQSSELSSSQTYLQNSRLLLKELHQIVIKLIKQIRFDQDRIQTTEQKNASLLNELIIVRSLNMKQNCMDMEKEKEVNDVLITKWKKEITELREKCCTLEHMSSYIVTHYNMNEIKNTVANIYALFELGDIPITLNDDTFKAYQKCIQSCKEPNRKLTAPAKKQNQKQDKNEKKINRSTTKSKKKWKVSNQNTCVCSIDEIQKEELLKKHN